MNIHFLPGLDPKTEAWAEKLMGELSVERDHLSIQRYDHWQEPGSRNIEIETEIEKLQRVTVDLLIAKSIGTVLALFAVKNKVVRPQKMVLIGVPVLSCARENIDLKRLAEELRIPALYIQQKDDVVGSSDALYTEVGKAPLAQIVETPGNNHQYEDLTLLCRHMEKFMGGASPVSSL